MYSMRLSFDAGSKVALAAPSLLFLLSAFWASGSCFRLLNRLKEEFSPKSLRINQLEGIIDDHFYETIFSEGIIVFAINGSILILELGQTIAGVLELLFGVVLGITGLCRVFISGRDRMARFCLDITMGVAFGQFVFFTLYNEIPLGNHLVEWVGFLVSTIAGAYVYQKDLIARLYAGQ